MRKWRKHFVNPKNSSEAYYDIFEDYALIEASFAQQYGIRLRKEKEMSWDEFSTLLSGLNPETPLGNIVSIRSETNKDILKHFTPQQKKIRSDWAKRNAKSIDSKQYVNDMKMFEQMFRSMAKVGENNGR